MNTRMALQFSADVAIVRAADPGMSEAEARLILAARNINRMLECELTHQQRMRHEAELQRISDEIDRIQRKRSHTAKSLEGTWPGDPDDGFEDDVYRHRHMQ